MAHQPPTTMDERIVTLTYRVARGLGYSRRASARLCRQILLNAEVEQGICGDAQAARRARTRLLDTIRAAVGPRVDRARLDRALDLAVLADELALLPPRQQAAVRWAVEEQCTTEQIAERTGWRPQQVACLLRAGLATLAARGRQSTRDELDPIPEWTRPRV